MVAFKPSPHDPRRLLMTMFGWNESGGGTMLPRLIAAELVRRGWEVSVFHAAVAPVAGEGPYTRREWLEDGVRLVGIHNRPSVLFDIGQPLRELDDPQIRLAFRAELDHFQPDVIHFHNLHNLGASLIDEASVRGAPTFYTTHNYWLICQRAYLMYGSGEMCPGPGDGTRCATCVGSTDQTSHRRRLDEIRGRVASGITQVFAVSDSVRRTLIATGYDPEAICVVRQAMPTETVIWDQVGRDRPPGRRGSTLSVAFLGSAYPHKGPQLLVQAAQRTNAEIRVKIIGEVPAQFADQLRAIDDRAAVEFAGSYNATELQDLLSDVDAAVLPSMWWDCAPLSATEAKAARLPLVVPRLGGLPECVRDGVDGLTFAGLDADDLAVALDRLATEPGLLERLQAAIEPPMAFAHHVDELEARYRSPGGQSVAGSPPAASPTKPPAISPPDVEVRWKGDHGLPTSLSIINDRVTSLLPGPVQRVGRDMRPLDAPLSHGADLEVRHEWPPDLSPPPAGRLAAIVPWEFGAIPSEWLGPLQHNVDELWVPSEFVRRMYLDAGVDPGRVRVIPNGVDPTIFHPAEHGRLSADTTAVRFLFVGGVTGRKGTDLLMAAWDQAFTDRDDVMLVFKAAMAAGAYGGPSERLRAWAAQARPARVDLIEDDLSTIELAELYRTCDVFVLPYRGEGFAMPVLEAMASGLPTIVTEGGPTDEFCPPDAGWRIRSHRRLFAEDHIDGLKTIGRPWLLEPELDHLVELLRTAADVGPAELRGRGAIARAAAERLSWETVAAMYAERIGVITTRRTRRVDAHQEPFPLEDDAQLRVLATPAWRGADRLPELLADWARHTTQDMNACLYLLADPDVAGTSAELEARVLAAAEQAGVGLDACADIEILVQSFTADRDQRLHRTMDAYVPLHAGCAARERLAGAVGQPVVLLGTGELGSLLAG